MKTNAFILQVVDVLLSSGDAVEAAYGQSPRIFSLSFGREGPPRSSADVVLDTNPR